MVTNLDWFNKKNNSTNQIMPQVELPSLETPQMVPTQIDMSQYGLQDNINFNNWGNQGQLQTIPDSMGLPEFGSNQNVTSSVGGGSEDGFWNSFKNLMLDSEDKNGFKSQGLASPLIGLGSSIMNGWMGMEKLGLMEDQLAFQKDAFNKNYENQRSLTNTYMRDRQRVRDSATGRNTVDEYMKNNALT